MRLIISILFTVIIALFLVAPQASTDQNRTVLMSIGNSNTIDDVESDNRSTDSDKGTALKDGITSKTGGFIIDYKDSTGYGISPDWELDDTSVNLISGLFNFRPSMESESYIIKQQPSGAFTSVYSGRSKERFIEGIRFIQVNVFRDY